jgi:hypothetical protein
LIAVISAHRSFIKVGFGFSDSTDEATKRSLRQMVIFFSIFGTIHTALSVLAILAGGYVLFQTRSKQISKIGTLLYIPLMLLVNVMALLLVKLFHFGPFHVLAYSLLALTLAALFCLALWKSQLNWRYWHFLALVWSYMGLLIAFVSGYLVELPFISYGIPFVASVVCVSLPMLVGGHQIILRKKAFFL